MQNICVSFTFLQGFGLMSNEALNCLLWAAVRIVRGLFGPRRPSLCRDGVSTTNSSDGTPPVVKQKPYDFNTSFSLSFLCDWNLFLKPCMKGNTSPVTAYIVPKIPNKEFIFEEVCYFASLVPQQNVRYYHSKLFSKHPFRLVLYVTGIFF